MKHTRFLYLLILIAALTACAPAFPKVDSFYISPFKLTTDYPYQLFNASYALSPNGDTVFVTVGTDYYLADLATGKKIDLRKQLGMTEIGIANADNFSIPITWSFDGKYLGIPANHYNPEIVPKREYAFYVFNLQDNTYKRYDFGARFFSPFDSNQLLTENGVYNSKDGTTIPLSPDFDFRQEKEFRAGDYWDLLWSKSLGVPVAQIGTLPRDATKKDDIEVVVESFAPKPPYLSTYTVSTGFVSKHPNQLSGLFFDPTGEYILISEWQCHESPTPCTITPFHADNVYDTVLTLVRWHAKEQKELIRLSAIDSKNVVAYGDMAWSADGSTIFISRKDGLPIVIKLK